MHPVPVGGRSGSSVSRSALAVGVGALAWALVGASPARAACPNESIRSAQSATALPDCRAYELVSPPPGTPYLQQPNGAAFATRASSDGGGIAWFSYVPLPGSAGGGFYDLSTRAPNGWSTANVGPGTSAYSATAFACLPSLFFSSDLSQAVLMDGFQSMGAEQGSETGYCGSNTPPLVEDEPEGFQNVFLRESATGAYRLVNLTPSGAKPADAAFQAASSDFSHIVFEESARLTPEAPPEASLYEWAAGALHLATVLPDGTPTEGALPGAIGPSKKLFGTAPYTHPVSADGTRIVFEAEGKLYLRENADRQQSAIGPGGECVDSARACTIQLDASHASGPGGDGAFLAADAADTKIYFTDDAEAGLTTDTTPFSGQNLYAYDATTGALSDLTPAGELGLLGLTAVSEDGAYLYFVAEGALVSGATAGQPNLYVVRSGVLGFVATLSEEDRFDWLLTHLTARTSADGRYLAFNSVQKLTEYDNTDITTGNPDGEIYRYDALAPAMHAISCVSCDPSGVRPSASSAIPAAEGTGNTAAPKYLQRNLLDDGRVYFETREPLLASAANGRINVYENDAGHIRLISSGSSAADSYFYDASQSGNDVFLVTTQHLVHSDTGNGPRLYDARVNGGFEENVESLPCSGEGCRAAPGGTPPSGLPPTSIPGGTGNLAPPPPLKVKVTPQQALQRALRSCRRYKSRRKRAACVRRAHRRYTAVALHTHWRGGHK